jgi:hypothetical protein
MTYIVTNCSAVSSASVVEALGGVCAKLSSQSCVVQNLSWDNLLTGSIFSLIWP